MSTEKITAEKEEELLAEAKKNGTIPVDFQPPKYNGGEDSTKEEKKEEKTEEESKEEDSTKEVESKSEEETKEEESSEENKEESETKGFINPFLQQENEKKEEQTDYKVLYEQAQRDNEVLKSFLSEEETQFILTAKDKGQSIFDLLREVAPLDVERMTKGELIEKRLTDLKNKFNFNDEKLKERKEKYEEMSNEDFNEDFYHFKKELAASQKEKSLDVNFDFEQKVVSQREVQKRLTELQNTAAKNLDSIVGNLIEGGNMKENDKEGFYKEVEALPPLFDRTEDGLVVPNVNVIAELTYWRTIGMKTHEKEKKEAVTSAKKQEQEKRKNTNAHTSTPIVPSSPKEVSYEDLLKEANTALHNKK